MSKKRRVKKRKVKKGRKDYCWSCGDEFTYKDLDGGRCLSCGTMIS